ncbi:MAG: precorrin-4 C(11)-methyltransferase [Desulfovibrionaceae bacterium]|nr:precorrin-4 C(11)-methyltransferase [Desulfovibrionaceae bacterium]
MNAHVTFVGAGPGAEDLITVRGLRTLEEADLVVYAGSLVNPAHLKACKAGCICLDSSSMTLEEQIETLSSAALQGRRVVRLHTGDPALYGAINEQIRALAEKGVSASMVPGVSSVFAAAAALGCELTCPGGSQSVVLTRSPGRTPMPESEDAAAFARTGATLVFFLSAGRAGELTDSLIRRGGLPATTPAALVYRASWPDQRILRGSLGDLARQAEEAGIGRQALILVGQALEPDLAASRLYDAGFSHGYRNQLPDESFSGRCALYAFTDTGLTRARNLAAGLGLPVRVYSTRPCPDQDAHPDVVHVPGQDFRARFASLWDQYDAHIFIGAAGIAVRAIAPLLRDKASDPAVLACPENGAHVISLCAGHLGGANRLARRVARLSGGQAVISTATDVRDLPAFDEAAAREQARILNTESIKALNAALLDGIPIAFCGPRPIFDRHFAASGRVIFVDDPRHITQSHVVLWDRDAALPQAVCRLDVSSRAFVLGIGCRRGADPQTLRLAAERFLAEHGLNPGSLAALASCDIKTDEAAILDLGRTWAVPVNFHAAADLDAVPVPTASERVRDKVGTASVCEAACLLSAGWGGSGRPRLHAPKTVRGDVTLALARLPHRASSGAEPGSPGSVTVVGLGSGSPGQITPEADAALRRCDTVAGYGPYVDFIRGRIAGKPVIQSGMRGEMERCRASLEEALAGREVCMVCSGDPGILAMAGLLYELRLREARFADIPIRVLPGITAASIAAAALGAPLQNGFCLVSLSDLLVPADEVRQNLRAAARSALPAVLYNPAGRKRRDLLHEALLIFREQRGGEVPCAWVKNAGRPGESAWTGTLADFPADDVDMSTVVILGGPRTRLNHGVLYEARGYMEKYGTPGGMP